jgi:putative redox protein
MVKIEIKYEGELRCSARHLPSGRELETDAPVDNQGRGASFSPTDLVATALATCMATTMGIVARREGMAIEGTAIEITKEMTSAPPRRIARLTTTIRLPVPRSADPQGLLERAALNCPVYLSVHPEVEKPVQLVWAD